MQDHLPRKLAVILHADVVGSTRLVQQHETLAHERMQDAFQRLSGTIKSYGGVARELRGDALVAEFERASDAVSAALLFQRENNEFNARVDDDIRPNLRIGISMGEVIITDDTVTGAGVVLAQRLEQLAEPGGICIQGAAHETVPQRLPFEYENLAEQRLKGFDQPVRVFRVALKPGESIPEPEPGSINAQQPERPRGQWSIVLLVVVFLVAGILTVWLQPWKSKFAPASIENMAFPLPDNPSIVVLPFDNYSDDPGMDIFVNGLTEDLTSALSRLRALFVIARNTATKYKGQAVDVKQVAEELGVQYILEGSVQKSDDQLRITIQLIDALLGNHVWTERFDRNAGDIFALQDEIVKRVATELAVELTEGDRQRRHLERESEPMEAWLLNKEAYVEYLKFNRASQVRAREIWGEVLEISPDDAVSLAGIAFTHWVEGRWGWSESRDKSIRLGKEAAKRSIEADPDEPLGYQALGNLYLLDKQYQEGIALRRKAVEIAPNDFSAVGGLALSLNEVGQEAEAVELFERAIRLSPKPPWWVPYGYGISLHHVGRKEDAAVSLNKAILLSPKRTDIRVRLAAVYVDLGETDEAAQVVKDVMRLKSNFSVTTFIKINRSLDDERNDWLRNLLLSAGLPE